MIQEFTKYGYSVCPIAGGLSPAAITTADQVFSVKGDTTVSAASLPFPRDCYISTVEIEVNAGVTGTPSTQTVTMYLARDSAGDIPITTDALNGATQLVTMGKTTATKGGFVFTVNTDYHFDSNVTNAVDGTIFLVAKVNSGNLTGNIRINWRA